MAHATPHTSLRSAYGATNNRRPARTPSAGRSEERRARLKPLHRTKPPSAGRSGTVGEAEASTQDQGGEAMDELERGETEQWGGVYAKEI